MDSFGKSQKLKASITLGEKRTDAFEVAAFGASFLCLAHCLALPLILAALPAFSDAIGTSDTFHIWVLALAIPSSAVALIAGRSRHSRVYPVIAGALGLVLLVVGAFLAETRLVETATTVVGSLTLAAAHIANWRLRNATKR